jgi:hypothetical protein
MSDNKNANNQVIGTSDMPHVETLKYETYYKVSPVFMNDLKIILQDVAYADAIQYFDFLKNYNYILPVAVLQEFINMLEKLPFGVVSPIIEVIKNDKLFPKYFEDVTPKPANTQPEQPAKK